MDSNEFWCRAYLAEMQSGRAPFDESTTHDEVANHCEGAANAALAVAQRRGVVTGERVPEPASRDAVIGMLVRRGYVAKAEALASGEHPRAVHTSLSVYPFTPGRDECLVALAAMTEAPGPTLERVEFKADPGPPGMWCLRIDGIDKWFYADSGEEKPGGLSVDIRIKWGESTPPRPLEVWIERAVAAK